MKPLLVALALTLASCSSEPYIEQVSLDEFASVVAGHRGQPLLVYAWADWARLSVEFLPSVVELSQEYGATETAVILLRLDGREETFPAPVSQYVLSDDVEPAMGRLGLADLPAALVYSTDGNLRHKLENSGEYPLAPADIADAVSSVLP